MIDYIFSVNDSEDSKHIIVKILWAKIKIKKIKKENLINYKKFIKYLEKGFKTKFVSYIEHDNKIFDVKAIAFYLPQFYNFKENDEWHGKGFTEWTNVTKSIPQYTGHYQPRLPIDLGFYNLNNTDTMYRQIELAKNYGIYAFCFYYYWFSGKKIMEKPIYNYLNDKNLQFPFCLCWACENWSKMWDGGNKEILIESDLKFEDFEQFWNDILPFINDNRYIKINNKPVIIMYKPHKFDHKILKSFLKFLKSKAKESGFVDIYIIWAITNDLTKEVEPPNYLELGFNAILEFPPHGIRNNINNSKNVPVKKYEGYINPDFNGVIYDMEKYLKNKQYKKPLYGNTNIYRGVFPMWDNSARKAKTGCLIFDGITPKLYKSWLSNIISWTIKNRRKEERYIFINAWNEWAEGAYLELDSKYGYAYLQATREALEETAE